MPPGAAHALYGNPPDVDKTPHVDEGGYTKYDIMERGFRGARDGI
jgi:hypothetical protein